MSFLEVLYFIVPSALLYATPLILTGIGALFSERAGVIGLGVEGLMIVGAFTGIYINLEYYADFGKNVIWLALLAALLAGAIFSLIIAVAAVTFRADQTVTGVALNMLAAAITVFLVKLIYGKGQTDMVSAPLQRFEIPYLSDIPFLGPLLFQNVYSTTIIALVVAIGAWFVLYKMPFGLRIRSVGEHPMAADTMGINVAKMRYIGVMISGALAGVGGASLAMTSSGDFSGSTVAGQGFIAIAAMIFGKWHPIGTLGAALFFGLAQTLSIGGGNIPYIQDIPPVILQVLPYVLTILALAGFVGKAVAPKASGIPYIKGKR
ncbi:simple sugar transport system permease protein [Solibacillus kalamii]|uniref:Sugar ABC transporter permease n=1 Tax=Solibacillus kalamii TaxID=1748298 RepID=A0ABX3ZKW0_9BACL|nr:ABC transporter permease [Solibacillus kalamii]MBM7665231.1 simple sugar transport system permease protein [Solibacillus kalamii]OUZ40408.1 sugar ABC transporter permease [Solibacillus kalamii]